MSLFKKVISFLSKKRLIKGKFPVGLLLLCICLTSGCDLFKRIIFNIPPASDPVIEEVWSGGENGEKIEGENGSYRALPTKKGIKIDLLVRPLLGVIVDIDSKEIQRVKRDHHVVIDSLRNQGLGYYFADAQNNDSKTWRWVVHVFAPEMLRNNPGGFTIGIRSKSPNSPDETSKRCEIRIIFRSPWVNLTADKEKISPGDWVALLVETELASHIELTPTSPQWVKDYNIDSRLFSQFKEFCTVQLQATTTYTASAVGPGGRAQDTAEVKVIPHPTVTLTAEPNIINKGNSSNLKWTSENAVKLSLDQGIGSIAEKNGSKPVKPNSTTTYKITAENELGKTNSATATVKVQAPPPVRKQGA